MTRSLLALPLLALLPFAAAAQDNSALNYNYVEGGYISTNNSDSDADGFAAGLGEILGSTAAVERYAVLAGDRGRAFSWLGAAERVWQLHADL